jgi:DNA-binding SARP family transcriptional activator
VADAGVGSYELRLLGGFALSQAGTPVPLGSVEQRLVVLIALHGRPLRREVAVTTLWPEADAVRGAAALRSAVWRLRGAAAGLVAGDRERLALTHVTCDLELAAQEARRLVEIDAVPSGSAAFNRLSQDLLPDWPEDWVAADRERFRQARLHALEAACRTLTRVGQFATAIDAGEIAVDSDPLRESAHRALIEAHIAEGNRSEALRQYARCARVLADELGLAPSPALTTLAVPPGAHAVLPAAMDAGNPARPPLAGLVPPRPSAAGVGRSQASGR